MQHRKSSSKMEVYSNTGLTQIDNLTYHLKELEKIKDKAQHQQKEGNNKDQRVNK